jgi:hypothetical protein
LSYSIGDPTGSDFGWDSYTDVADAMHDSARLDALTRKVAQGQ